MKRAFDVVASSLGLIVLSPLFAMLAVWIKCDSPGPVFFRQVRVGRHGKPFRMFKLRTMVVDAERLGPQVSPSNDRRVTRLGAFLRRYKLDELPELINVVGGDMSLVGPRPDVPRHVAFYTSEERRVFDVRPGITDVASLAYLNESDILAAADDPEATYIETVMPAKLALNLEYLRRAGLVADIGVIFRTLWAVVAR